VNGLVQSESKFVELLRDILKLYSVRLRWLSSLDQQLRSSIRSFNPPFKKPYATRKLYVSVFCRTGVMGEFCIAGIGSFDIFLLL